MSEHQMKEALQKSTHKPQVAAQNAPVTAEGSNDELIRLQRLVGNHAVQRLIADNAVDVKAPPGLIIQTKMTVGAADDPYEREADHVASQVMAQRTIQREEADEAESEDIQTKRISSIQRDEAGEAEDEEIQTKRMANIQRDEAGEAEDEEIQTKRMPNIQRDEADEAEDEEIQTKRMDVQRKGKDMSGSFDVNQDVEDQISAKAGHGQAIPEVNRDMFESSMGHDFSGVNVHTDSQSDSLNKDIGARAFTTGSDIFFRQGEYNPNSADGQRLLAHELTHVVQQGGAGVKKKSDEE